MRYFDIGAFASSDSCGRATFSSNPKKGDDGLVKLRQLLPENIALLVGGRSSSHYSDVLQQIGASRLVDLQSFRVELESLRSE
jgi:hypothetical protein